MQLGAADVVRRESWAGSDYRNASRSRRGGRAIRVRPGLPAKPARHRPAVVFDGRPPRSRFRDGAGGNAERRGMAFLLDLGAAISDAIGERLAPVAMVLETYNRNP